MKRIALTIYSLQSGGAEKVVSNLSQSLSKYFDVFIFIFDDSDQVYEVAGKLVNLDVPIGTTRFSKVTNVIKRKKQLEFFEKKYNIDVNISFMNNSNLINVLSNSKTKKIVSLRSNNAIYQKGIQHYVDKFIYSRADNIVSVSKVMESNLINTYPFINKYTSTIENYVDHERLNSLSLVPINYQFNEKKKYIISLGRLEKVKGHYFLLRALKKVKETYPNFILLIIGQGTLKLTIESYVKELDLVDNVQLLGQISNPYPYLSQADLYVLTSLYEGMPNGMLESMALSLPIISVDCETGPKEILCEETKNGEEYGILVDSFKESNYDVNAELSLEEIKLADAINSILKNDTLREMYRRKSIQRSQQYSKEVIVYKWIELIHRSIREEDKNEN